MVALSSACGGRSIGVGAGGSTLPAAEESDAQGADARDGALDSSSSSRSLPPDGAAQCAASILTFEPSDAFAACWDCAKPMCASQLSACSKDCTCNGIIGEALACAAEGNSAGGCNCSDHEDGGPFASDASMSDPNSGGLISFWADGGECTSTMEETYEGTDYEVTCSCPEGACVCFGPTTHIVTYAGCPYCPDPTPVPLPGSTSAFSLCGFPQYSEE
jgi:hypothetical protein